jgi:predicted Zn finger-like uncharacterized protein
MRITCPDCDSVYDVPERAVPDPGRDVQCAACGASWFLLKGGASARSAPAPDGVAPAAARAADRPAPDTVAGVATAGVGLSDRDEDTSDGDENGTVGRQDAEQAMPPRRRLDPEVLAILREEAETERRARSAAAGPASGKPTTSDVPRARVDAVPARDDRRENDMRADERSAADADRATDAPKPPDRDMAGLSDPNGRLARLTAAERDTGQAKDGQPSMPWPGMGDDMDHGLVEDTGAARRAPRPPLIEASQPAPPALRDTGGMAGLPVAVRSQDHQALVILQHRRRGFRLGFAATAGLCCAALAVYLLALRADDGIDGPIVQAVRHHGGQVQAALVDWLRRVVVPVLS